MRGSPRARHRRLLPAHVCRDDSGDGSGLADKFGQIEIAFANGRVGNEVRNDLIFELTGGAGNPAGAPYRLMLNVRNSTTAAAVVSPLTGLPEVELVTVDVSWQLYDVGNLKVPVATGNAIGKASLDSGYQRFARNRAIRDAENRSSRVAAESIRTQLAAYFVNPKAAAPVAAPSAAAELRHSQELSRHGRGEARRRRGDAHPHRPAASGAAAVRPGQRTGRERTRAYLARAAAGSDDPFGLVRLDGDEIAGDPGRLVDEAGTVALFGGRRVISLRVGSRNVQPAWKHCWPPRPATRWS